VAVLTIAPPFPLFTDADGTPLENGYVYIGQPYLDPQTNPITVYWDAALTIPAAQPLRTLNGYFVYDGSPANAYIGSDYSMRVANKNNSFIYSFQSASAPTIPGSFTVDRFSGDGLQITFILSIVPGTILNTQVYINGVYQNKDTYVVSGSTLQFSQPPPLGIDNVEVVMLSTYSVGVVNADNVIYDPSNVNAVSTTVATRLDDIYRYHPNINNVATVTVYCDPVSGSDSNPGTLLQPYQTFQHAVDMCPQTLTFQYIIDLVSAATLPVTYNEDVLIRDIHAPVTDPSVPFLIGAGLQIIGAGPDFLTDDPKDCKIGSLTISGCSGLASPELFGAHILRASPYYQSEEYIGIYATEEAQLYNLSFEPVLPAIAGVRVFRAGVTIKGIDITGLAHAIWAKRLANGNVFNWYGTYWTGSGAGAVFRSEESSIVTIGFDASVSGGSAPVGVTNANLFNYNYGLVADLFGIRFARRMFYGNPEYNSTYGTDSFGAGENFNISGAQSVAIGLNARGDAAAAVSIGPNSDAGATASVAVGSATLANSGIRATAIGSQAEATGSESVALGFDAEAAYANSNAIGAGAVTPAANTTRIGNTNNTVTQTYGYFESLSSGAGVYLKSPNGTRYALTVDNAGALVIAAAP
jgi:hypothetical protein